MSDGAKQLRLSKVAKEFNLSLGKIVEFLASKGKPVDNNPNAKIGDEEYRLLQKEFSGDKNAREEAEQQSQAEPHEIHFVGQDAFAQVRYGQHDHQCAEDRPFQGFGVQSKNQIAGQEEQPRSQLHHRIHRGDAHLAFATAAREHKPAHHRYVVVGFDRSPARRAMRWRQNDRFRIGYAQDADVQETADGEPE